MRQRSRHGIGILVLAMTFCGLAATLAQARPVLFARRPMCPRARSSSATTATSGSRAPTARTRCGLTANLARNTFPRLSPDGKWVAFTSNRMGNDDVWVMPAAGGEPRQLTFSAK